MSSCKLLTVNDKKSSQNGCCQVLDFMLLICQKSFVGQDLPRPAGGAYSTTPNPLAASWGKRGKGEKEGWEREGKTKEREKEGGKEERGRQGEEGRGRKRGRADPPPNENPGFGPQRRARLVGWLVSICIPLTSKFHLQLTRTENMFAFNIPSTTCSCDYHLQSFFPRTFRDWNTLPQEVVQLGTVEAF